MLRYHGRANDVNLKRAGHLSLHPISLLEPLILSDDQFNPQRFLRRYPNHREPRRRATPPPLTPSCSGV